MLQEHREFLKEMSIKEDCGGIDTGSFLPRILYELFLQVQSSNNDEKQRGDRDNNGYKIDEIASKLSKVWKILFEFLNHQSNTSGKTEKEIQEVKSLGFNDSSKASSNNSQEALGVSVSKTFLKLRDLIFEKRSLQRDTTRLKTLYSHLEQRLNDQEKKLSSVSLELTKTWHLVGKIKVSILTTMH